MIDIEGLAEKMQSDKWATTLSCRSVACRNPADVQRVLDQLEIDYPHVLVRLVSKGHAIGLRRVFGDRSFADMYFGGTLIETGVMSEGLLGEAPNGRDVTAMH